MENDNSKGISVPENYKHLLKAPEQLSRNRDDYNSRKRNIVAYCVGVERSQASIEKANGYKPHSSATVLRELIAERKLWKPARGYYKAVEVDQTVKEAAETDRRTKQLEKLNEIFKQFMWENDSADWHTLRRLMDFINEQL